MRPNARRAAWLALLAAAAACRSDPQAPARPELDEPLRVELPRETGAELVSGNALAPIENGAIFDAIVEDIGRAKESVHILTFIWREPDGPSRRVSQALLERAPGVACRIVVDAFGSLKLDGAQEEALKKSGCELRRYGLRKDLRPTARNHRKLVVVDGETAFTGGFGYHRSWEGDGRSRDHWRESSVRVRGPVVAQLQRAFDQSWQEAGGAPLPPGAYPRLAAAGGVEAAFVASSPRGDDPSAAEKMTKLLIAAAKQRLWIANAYFLPDDAMQELIAEKARQGVEVRVLAPGPVHDAPPVRAGQRESYEKLLAAGVRIFEYQPSMMHAKTMLVDDRWTVVGSTNIDQLSFDRLEEGSLVARSTEYARHLERRLRADFGLSKEITREEWAQRDPVVDVAREATELFDEWL